MHGNPPILYGEKPPQAGMFGAHIRHPLVSSIETSSTGLGCAATLEAEGCQPNLTYLD